MKFFQIVFVAILSVAATVAALHYGDGTNARGASLKETAYERVIRTGTLRCGYLIYPRFIERDPNTNAFSGMWVDILEKVTKQLNLKLEWTEEIGHASAFEGLKTGRYDINCAVFSQTPSRSRETAFTVPVVYLPYYAYVRADDTRFDNAYEKINDPSVRFVYLEGEFAQLLREQKFPNSQSVSLPNLTDITQILLNVAMGKADIATTEPTTAERFLLEHPGQLKRVPGPSLMMHPIGFNAATGEHDLLNMLNTTLHYLLASGEIEKIANKYTTGPDQFFLPGQAWGNSSQISSGKP